MSYVLTAVLFFLYGFFLSAALSANNLREQRKRYFERDKKICLECMAEREAFERAVRSNNEQS